MRDSGRFGPIEWALAGRPRPGERVCGDQPLAVQIDDDAALFGVMDGLGHGPAAATAAITTVDVLTSNRGERLEVLVQLCHRVLTGTRGVAMTLARIEFTTGRLSWTGVGNVTASLVAKAVGGVSVRSSVHLAGGIVGYRIPDITPAKVVPIRAGDLLVIASDGIADDHLEHIDFAASAPTIADQILAKHAKDTDDAVVLAARHRGIST
ncbi:SpoIIE family protein phosphatase [Mycobacterium shinjukuense]|uniref:Stage II sporulation protein E n=1 Tax=Mycobacterium shinjukuense TaxID=398694 RepID=A0A7I7MVD0_9MYCO|nr:SpoIIE family protein phosphatase [Mycobacterium shinjukuense]MCV6986677.1 SpoIIE family protein phosphatase [Mycobacterium shinjukuense]ORB69127.1 stage II sporulation protein M [Mycobacterium shinjukuense]BBX75822.1 stage II sporulation protein E [Mycobacterium shinjukuense]